MANEFVIKNGYFSQGNSNVTGSLRVSGSIGVVGSGSDVLSVYGSQGNLLVATDTFSGSIFTVTDISGYPILDVTSDYYTNNVLISGGFSVYSNTYGYTTLNSDGYLFDSTGIPSVDWINRNLSDNISKPSVAWQDRTLAANDGSTIHIDWSNTAYMNFFSTTQSPITRVLGMDDNNNVYWTSSTAIGGGGGGDFVPNAWTGSSTSQFSGTASLANTSSYFRGPGGAIISDDGNGNITHTTVRTYISSSNRMFIYSPSNGVDINGAITISGDIVPNGPYTNNTSSYNLGSPTAAWDKIYVSNNSLHFVSGSVSASIGFNNGVISFNNATVNIPTGSTVPTASLSQTSSYVTGSIFTSANPALSASYAVTASFVLNAGGTFNSTSSVIGNGLSSSFNINHGFNTRNLHITIYESSSNGETEYPDVRRINANTASIIFANPPSSNQYIVYISQ